MNAHQPPHDDPIGAGSTSSMIRVEPPLGKDPRTGEPGSAIGPTVGVPGKVNAEH